METGELINYHVKPGDHVKAGQMLFEVMTDKIDMEVEVEMKQSDVKSKKGALPPSKKKVLIEQIHNYLRLTYLFILLWRV